MNSSRLKYEGWLYGLAFLLALGFRLVQLGAAPLADSEAQFALQALQIAQGKATLLGPQPAYILFTSILFLVIESTNFMARLAPALVGSLLVFAPYYFRERLHPRPALILAFLFAFDPGLTALSRQASGTIFAVTFLLFAWGMWINGRAIPAGIFAGLALLSGPSIWSGVLMLGITFLFWQGMKSNAKQDVMPDIRSAIIALISTLILAGTLFLTTPHGLSALFNSIPAYLKGWTAPSVFTPSRMLITFVGYEILGIFLAIFALIRGIRLQSLRYIRWGIWLGVSLLVAIFYRQTSELAWVIIPLLVLAARELSQSFDIFLDERVEVSVVAGAILILLIYIWFNVANIGLNPYEQFTTTPLNLFNKSVNLPLGPRYIVLIGASLILAVCIILVALGWSARTARLGTTWSFSLFLGIYALGAAWSASGVRLPTGVELWSPDQPPTQAKLLTASVNDISMLSSGHIDSQPVTIMGIQSPALEWALRNHEVKVVSVLDPLNAPPIVITPLMNELGLPSAYRGQDFTWRQAPLWDTIQPQAWIGWAVYRQLPRDTETIILWARDDMFPDARQDTQP
ncbi:MAG: hypothetical protein IPP66_04520 [Anaerolineales bacterium]|nr:hypothetical protein [Anaerolineales bacterium]